MLRNKNYWTYIDRIWLSPVTDISQPVFLSIVKYTVLRLLIVAKTSRSLPILGNTVSFETISDHGIFNSLLKNHTSKASYSITISYMLNIFIPYLDSWTDCTPISDNYGFSFFYVDIIKRNWSWLLIITSCRFFSFSAMMIMSSA